LRSIISFAFTLAQGVFQTGQWERSGLPKLCPSSGLLAAQGAAHSLLAAHKTLLPAVYLTADCFHEQTDWLEVSSLGLLVGAQESPLSLEDGATSGRILPMTWSC